MPPADAAGAAPAPRPPPRPKLTPAELREADALALGHGLPYRDVPPQAGWSAIVGGS